MRHSGKSPGDGGGRGTYARYVQKGFINTRRLIPLIVFDQDLSHLLCLCGVLVEIEGEEDELRAKF